MNGGKNVEEGSRYGMAKVNRQTQPAEQGRCRQTQPADDPTGTGLEVTTADDPADTGLAAKQQPQMKLAGLSPCSAGWWRECGGAGHSEGGLRPTLPVSLPPIAFACLCQYPLP